MLLSKTPRAPFGTRGVFIILYLRNRPRGQTIPFAMIKSVRLVNFFSFGDCTVELEPDSNVLVGINGSGKSNFLRAFQLLKAGMEGRLNEQIAQWGGVSSISSKNSVISGGKSKITLSFTLSGSIPSQLEDDYEGDIVYQIDLLKHSANEYMIGESVKRIDGKIYFDALDGDGYLSSEALDKINEKSVQGFNNGRELILPLLAVQSNRTMWWAGKVLPRGVRERVRPRPVACVYS